MHFGDEKIFDEQLGSIKPFSDKSQFSNFELDNSVEIKPQIEIAAVVPSSQEPADKKGKAARVATTKDLFVVNESCESPFHLGSEMSQSVQDVDLFSSAGQNQGLNHSRIQRVDTNMELSRMNSAFGLKSRQMTR